MGVDQAEAQAVQTASFNHEPHFRQLRHSHLRQGVQQRQRFRALPQRSKGKFRNDKRMDHNVPLMKMPAHFLIFRPKVINPDRRIRENQFDRSLRRGTAFNLGIVPPRDANLRALSRSMRALRASRTNAVFSTTPVNSWAVRTRSSSSARVVLIKTQGTDYSIK